MITELTPEGRKVISESAEYWRAAGLCTDPADFDRAEAAIAALYRSIGKSKPHFVRLSSPFAAEIYINLLSQTCSDEYNNDQLSGQLGGQIRGQLWDQFSAQLNDQINAQLNDQLSGQLSRQLYGQLRGQLRGQLDGQLSDQLWGQLGGQLSDQLWGQLWGQLGGQLGGQLRGQLSDQLWGQLGGQLSDQLWGQLGGQLGGQLRGQLRGQLGGQLRAKLRDTKLKYTGTWFSGQQDAWLWGFYEAGRKLGVNYDDEANSLLDHHCDLVRSIGWFYPFNDFCILTDCPEHVVFDDDARLHCEDGPAVIYRDGYSLFSWRGVRVSPEWITDKSSVTAQMALTWGNIEQRRAACEILGWDRILKELDARTIDKDADPQVGELLEVNIPDIGRERFLRVECGTKRQFALPVPPDMKTALQANSWTYGVDETVLRQLEVRT